MQELAKLVSDDYTEARQSVRKANGLRTVLSLLQPRSTTTTSQTAGLLKLRTYATKTLLGMAKDRDICHTLAQLQASRLIH